MFDWSSGLLLHINRFIPASLSTRVYSQAQSCTPTACEQVPVAASHPKAPITSAKLTKSGWYSMYMDAENQLSGCNISSNSNSNPISKSKSNGSKLIQICLQAHSCTHSMRVIASCCWFKWPGLTPSANRTENTRSREYTNRNVTQSGLMFCLRLRLAHTGLNELRLRTKLLF